MDQSFSDMLEFDTKLKTEIDGVLKNDPRFDTDDTPGISEDEFIMMKQALVDPDHEIWEGNQNKWAEVTHPLLADRLTNAIENEHSKAYPPETEETLSENFKDDRDVPAPNLDKETYNRNMESLKETNKSLNREIASIANYLNTPK